MSSGCRRPPSHIPVAGNTGKPNLPPSSTRAMTTAVSGLHPLPTPPLTRSRKSDFGERSRSRRLFPVSCFEVGGVSYRRPGAQLSLSNRAYFSLPEKSDSKVRSRQLFPVSCDYSCFEVREVTYRPPGTQLSLLNRVSFSLPEKSFGLIYGQSGSGKTTLLQLLAGLNEPTSGSICIQRYGDDGIPLQSPQSLPPERVGIVFQFPERYFVADTVLDEIVFGWPRRKSSLQFREQLGLNVQRAMNWVGLNGIPLDRDPHSLSGGYKRRLALAIQLVQVPDLLILDEPLAGLDWKARADVVKLLKHLKRELTVLVVSHDLKELVALVDHSWRMKMGGYLDEELLQV